MRRATVEVVERPTGEPPGAGRRRGDRPAVRLLGLGDGGPGVLADLRSLPFRRHGLAGVRRVRSYRDLDAEALPMAWHELHRALTVGAAAEVVTDAGVDDTGLAAGAGFEICARRDDGDSTTLALRARRSLADTVGPGMRLLVCGLNPSLHAADAGVGFVTSNNRFWPAALRAGIVTVERDPVHALRAHGLGMTDLVKRATPRAAELSAAEYRAGLGRLDRLCAWLRPGVVVMVGLAGWRAATDRSATTGWQERLVGDRPVYVMPSTSGLNARTSLDELVEHLRRAVA